MFSCKADLFFGGKECLEVKSEEVQGRLLSERKGKIIPCRGTEARKGTGTDSAEKKVWYGESGD